jgi:hypothetical protein
MKPETVRSKHVPQKYSPTFNSCSNTPSSTSLKAESDAGPATAPRLSQRRKSNSSSTSNLSSKDSTGKVKQESTTPVTVKTLKNKIVKTTQNHSLTKKVKIAKIKKIKTKRKSAEGASSDNDSDQEGDDSTIQDEDLLEGIELEYSKLQAGNQTQSSKKENLCAVCEMPHCLNECQGRYLIF